MSLAYEVRHFGAVSSTNEEAARLVGAVPDAVWCLASSQVKGVGRRGRAWVSPEGNFYGSLLMPCDDSPLDKALRSFVAALALRDALLGYPDLPPITLKWPNDVLVGGGKVAGILLESVSGHLIIGVGVNLVSAPPVDAVETRSVKPIALADFGVIPSLEDFQKSLVEAFAQREDMFRTFGFSEIRRDWLAHAAQIGAPITARLPNEEVSGVFETVDDHGALVLKTHSGLRSVMAADVFFEGT